MLNIIELREILHQPLIKRREQILIILSNDAKVPKSIGQIKAIAKEAGLYTIEKWNVSQVLIDCKGLAVKIKDGWILTTNGKEYIAQLSYIENKRSSVKTVAFDLRNQMTKITDKYTLSFLEEAVSCFEHRNYRAAVVLSWVGAVYILYSYVLANCLTSFNQEATRRDVKWKDAKTIDDLSRMKEKDFLDCLVFLSIIGKNVKQELEGCLTLRNACGHPNSLEIGENRVASHIEILILNVFLKY